MKLKQKKKYVFLIGLAIIGIISGFIFSFIISKGDKLLVESSISKYIYNINNNNINYYKTFINSFSSSFLYTILIWILGISIIGIPIILFLLFLKGFILGFSIGSIINIYKIKGILGAILYIFPHHIIIMIIYILLSYFAFTFSKKLFNYLFLKQEENLKKYARKYLKVLLIAFVVILVCSIIETFLSPILFKLFTNYVI